MPPKPATPQPATRTPRHVAALTVAAAALAVWPVLAGCGASPSPATQSSGLTPVNVATITITDGSPFFVALRHGYFTQAGLDVRYQTAAQSTAVIPELLAGRINVMGGANYVSTFESQINGTASFKIVAEDGECGTGTGTGTDSVLALPRSGITRPSDLAGKTYIDNDPVVINHLSAVAAKGDKYMAAIPGDLRDPTATLAALTATGLINFTRPACLILALVLHFLDPGKARDVAAAYIATLAPGSHVIISVGRGDDHLGQQITSTYNAATLHNHTPDDIASFFDGLELVPPGLVDARAWQPGWLTPPPLLLRAGQVLAGAGTKTGPRPAATPGDPGVTP